MFKSFLQRAGLALLVTAAIWAAIAWPLPRHLFDAIPFSYQPEPRPVRAMTPGDHLQLLYHFWLAHDMLAGRTPLFYNLYEFNTGSDAERWAPDSYYAPFSLVYALGSSVSGAAFGWNLASFFSLWLGYSLAWLWARRFTASNLVASAAALIALLLPFRLATLFAGSPTGFAVAWTPLVAWGIDKAVRDDSRAGGCWAGLAILLSALGDLHVFYFALLGLPLWVLPALARRPDIHPRNLNAWKRLCMALAPVIVCIAFAALLTLDAGRGVAASVMAQGRSEQEIRLFTPEAQGFFARNTGHAPDAFVFIGIFLPAFLALSALAAVAWRLLFKRDDNRRLAAFAALALGLLLVALTALGPRGPFNGLVFSACRKWIPKFGMIRQSSKVFTLAPALLVAASAVSLECLPAWRMPRRMRAALPVLFACLLVAVFAPHFAPALCRLDNAQPVYAAIAKDAAASGEKAHALAVPLWPGDAHDSSLYQYYASLYHIRLVNGYSPKVSRDYVENIFKRFESVNAGCLDDAQINDLLARGVRHLVLHEDHFPDKTSPFPVFFTIRAFMNHPRLRLLAHERRVWAFSLLQTPETRPTAWPDWNLFFPARSWDAASPPATRAHLRLSETVKTMEDPEAWAGRIALLSGQGASLETRGVGVPSGTELCWLIRVRGFGALDAACRIAGNLMPLRNDIEPASKDWTWLNLAMPPLTNFGTISLRLELTRGDIDFDTARLLGGNWIPPAPRETTTWPAALFFHAGSLDENTGVVRFDADYDREGIVLYGPKLPLQPGRYRLEIEHASPAAAPGTQLGIVHIQWHEHARPDDHIVVAGKPVAIEFDQKNNLPFFIVFQFTRETDMELGPISLTRLR